MLSRYAVSWLAVMASTAAGGSVLRAADTSSIAPTANTTLSPVPNQNATGSTPSTSVQLNWGTNDTTAAIVQVSLAMNYSSVVLEDIPDVSSVDCDDTSVSVTFSTQNEFDAMQTSWSALADHFVMITNHVGDCDAEFERGFFLADVETLSFDSNSLTVRASVEKTDISSTSSEMSISFENLPTSEYSSKKRGISYDEDGLAISSDVTLDPNLDILAIDQVTVTANHVEVSSTVTYSGSLKYSIWDFKVTEFTFDVTKSTYHDLSLTLDFTAPYVYELGYDITPLAYYLVDIPGVLTLGPALSFGVGVNFTVEAELTVTADISSRVENGSIHIDLVNPDQSSISNWSPTYSATANITEKAAVIVDPYVATTIEMEAQILNGALDLSTGVTVSPNFPITFAATTTQDVASNGTISIPDEDCANGWGVNVDFEVGIEFFATQWASIDMTAYSVNIGSYCYDWF